MYANFLSVCIWLIFYIDFQHFKFLKKKNFKAVCLSLQKRIAFKKCSKVFRLQRIKTLYFFKKRKISFRNFPYKLSSFIFNSRKTHFISNSNLQESTPLLCAHIFHIVISHKFYKRAQSSHINSI